LSISSGRENVGATNNRKKKGFQRAKDQWSEWREKNQGKRLQIVSVKFFLFVWVAFSWYKQFMKKKRI